MVVERNLFVKEKIDKEIMSNREVLELDESPQGTKIIYGAFGRNKVILIWIKQRLTVVDFASGENLVTYSLSSLLNEEKKNEQNFICLCEYSHVENTIIGLTSQGSLFGISFTGADLLRDYTSKHIQLDNNNRTPVYMCMTNQELAAPSLLIGYANCSLLVLTDVVTQIFTVSDSSSSVVSPVKTRKGRTLKNSVNDTSVAIGEATEQVLLIAHFVSLGENEGKLYCLCSGSSGDLCTRSSGKKRKTTVDGTISSLFLYVKYVTLSASLGATPVETIAFDPECCYPIHNDGHDSDRQTYVTPCRFLTHDALNCFSIVYELENGKLLWDKYNMETVQLCYSRELPTWSGCSGVQVFSHCDGLHMVRLASNGNVVEPTYGIYDVRYGVLTNTNSNSDACIPKGLDISASTVIPLSIACPDVESGMHSPNTPLAFDVLLSIVGRKGGCRLVVSSVGADNSVLKSSSLCNMLGKLTPSVSSSSLVKDTLKKTFTALSQLSVDSREGLVASMDRLKDAVEKASVTTRSGETNTELTVNAKKVRHHHHKAVETTQKKTVFNVYLDIPAVAFEEFMNAFVALYCGNSSDSRQADSKDMEILEMCLLSGMYSTNVYIKDYCLFSISKYPMVLDYMMLTHRLDLVLLCARSCADVTERLALKLIAYCANLDVSQVSQRFLWKNNKALGKRCGLLSIDTTACDIGSKEEVATPKRRKTIKNVDIPTLLNTVKLTNGLLVHSMLKCLLSRPIGYTFNPLLLMDAMKSLFSANTSIFLLHVLSHMLVKVVSNSNKKATNTIVEDGVSNDEFIKRLVVWIEAILDAYFATISLQLKLYEQQSQKQSKRSDADNSSLHVMKLCHESICMLLKCVGKVSECADMTESVLGLWVHICRTSSSCHANGTGYNGPDNRHTRIGGNASATYQLESVYL